MTGARKPIGYRDEPARRYSGLVTAPLDVPAAGTLLKAAVER